MNAIVLFGVLVMSFITVRAQEIPILEGANPQNRISVQQIAQKIRPGQIIVMGEHHGFKTAQQGQLELMEALRAAGHKVSSGLEFFYYPDQALVDDYRLGALTEADFLQKIQWGQPSFDFYRGQALFPRYDQGERTLALNAPRSLTSRVSKVGLAGLTPEEQKLLPPGFQLGRDSYKKRFLSMMPHLPTPEAGERYFAAQSVWDDTMAWKAAEFIQENPGQILVIVVGDFHAQYGGGLPDRIEARTQQKPVVFSFVNVEGLSEVDIRNEVEPSMEYGPRADYIWFAKESTSTSN
ncbi:ChaN family lipoprotein [Bdellovibrio sp. HCB337]|uniref:ChaN family lipoprotein n=1 Tax=Bdellovibrio sp. HCB337 TaxID=3394358 RepID=UPI0039A61600